MKESLAQRFARLMFVTLPNWQMVALAAVVGAIWAASIFDWNFVTGRSPFWQFPHGTVSYSGNDMAQVLVGYLYYVQSPWHLPLFYVAALGTPVGARISSSWIAVPIVALIGKLVRSLAGANDQPSWRLFLPVLRSSRRNDDAGADRGKHSLRSHCNHCRNLRKRHTGLVVAMGAHRTRGAFSRS